MGMSLRLTTHQATGATAGFTSERTGKKREGITSSEAVMAKPRRGWLSGQRSRSVIHTQLLASPPHPNSHPHAAS